MQRSVWESFERKDDYGIMVLADRRFTRKKNQLPKWIAQALNDSDTNLSTDMALATAKSFCVVWRSQLTRDLEGVSIWNIEQLQEYQQQFQKDEMDIDEEDLDLL